MCFTGKWSLEFDSNVRHPNPTKSMDLEPPGPLDFFPGLKKNPMHFFGIHPQVQRTSRLKVHWISAAWMPKCIGNMECGPSSTSDLVCCKPEVHRNDCLFDHIYIRNKTMILITTSDLTFFIPRRHRNVTFESQNYIGTHVVSLQKYIGNHWTLTPKL